MSKKNYRQIKAIEATNRKRLLSVNPNLNDNSGIYILSRMDENGIKYAYIGQAKHILQRLCSHLTGYQQHIDLSIRKHGLHSSENPYGWDIDFEELPESELDAAEKYYIKDYAGRGYQLRNVSLGGQGENRSSGQIGERKPSKGYRDGIQQGRKNLAREMANIADKHLVIALKPEKQNNAVSQRQFAKFKELLYERGNEND